MLELNRFRDAESIAETTGPLDAANIAYKVGSTAVNFDISKIGIGDDPEVIISVRREDYAAAREVLEEEYAKFDLPEDHYLLSSSDEELVGLGIAWSICFMKEKIPDGDHYTYDAKLREKGRVMLTCSTVMLGVWIILRLLQIF